MTFDQALIALDTKDVVFSWFIQHAEGRGVGLSVQCFWVVDVHNGLAVCVDSAGKKHMFPPGELHDTLDDAAKWLSTDDACKWVETITKWYGR